MKRPEREAFTFISCRCYVTWNLNYIQPYVLSFFRVTYIYIRTLACCFSVVLTSNYAPSYLYTRLRTS